MGETEPSLGSYQDSGNMCYAGEVKTAFATAESIDSMKAMVARANPGLVLAAGFAWEKIGKRLATGEDSIKRDFDKAVEHVLQHWEGESADEFAKKAKRVSKQLSDAATYAQYTSTAMVNAGNTLTDVKPAVEAIEKPSGWDKGVDAIGDGFGRSEDWSKDIQNNQGAQNALDSHGGDLSAGKEEQLKAAAQMETLAVTYSSQSQTMGSWNRKPRPGIDDPVDYPGEPGGVAPVPVPVTPGGSAFGGGAVPSGRVTASGSSKSPATSSPRGFKNVPGAGTKIDGISGGTATEMGRGGAGTPSASGGAGAGIGGAAGGPNGVAGGPGMVGQASGNRGIAGAGAARARGGSPKAGIGAGAGAAGARGMGGMGGGAGAGAGGKGAAAGGRGPLARQRGGILDTPGASKGAAKQGGSSLHSSRGGAEAGQRGRGTPGMLGGAGANNGRGREKEGRENQRPDYLVEDEETWVPKRRDVAPPTIG